jgi:hypothetical protein
MIGGMDGQNRIIPKILKYVDEGNGGLSAFVAYRTLAITGAASQSKGKNHKVARKSCGLVIELICTRNNLNFGRPKWKYIEEDLLEIMKQKLLELDGMLNMVIILKADKGFEESKWIEKGFVFVDPRIMKANGWKNMPKDKNARWLMHEYPLPDVN